MKSIFKTALLCSLFSCETLTTTLGQGSGSPNHASETYQKNISMTVNGKKGMGMMSVPVAKTYNISLRLPAKAEVIRIWSCHREIISEKSTDEIDFFYSPLTGIESDGFCPLRIDAIDLAGVNGWGIIEFENRTLEASVFCNGEVRRTKGVSVCQSRVDLMQRILFFEEVIFEKIGDNCADLIPVKGMIAFDLPVSEDICVYLFKAKTHKDYHRLTTFGYRNIFLKSINPKNQ